MTFAIARARPEHLDAIVALFRACECTCFCRYWHFEGDKNAWLERNALEPQKNEAELRADVVRDEPRAHALVAFEGSPAGPAVGWMKLAPRASLPKLRARRDLRALDLGDDAGILSIGCMLVRPDMRSLGVARALVTFAIELAKANAARAIEAYPHAASGLGSHEVWMGPHPLYASLGFEHVTGELPYPVMRLVLRHVSAT
jgi:GNAT superfamily N-acetyltransferase